MNRVAIDLGFFQIYWYSIFIFLGILFASIVMFREIKKRNINEDFFVNLLFYSIIVGFLGARIYYCAFNFDYYSKNILEIFEIWNGGLAIHGGLLFGFLFVLYYTRKYKINTFRITDIAAPALLMAQAIGRWGNFFNSEAYGAITTKAQLLKLQVPNFIIEGMKIDGEYRVPTFLYESIWNLTGFFLLLIIRKYKYLKIGQLSGLYLVWYSFGRFFIEFNRADSLMLGPIKIAVLVSVLLFIIGIIMIIYFSRGAKFDNLYNERETNEIKF
ncbi:MAG: prolipoprotein diacylglyceryl transferase [Bacilli bacterium]